MPSPVFDLQAEFSGSGAGWTSIWSDVRAAAPITIRYGINGTSVNDRVAGAGAMSFALDNSVMNSAGSAGYYSPDHANKRSGFELGIRCRLSATYSGSTFYKFFGTLAGIHPMAGQYRDRYTLCSTVDWMDEAARHPLNIVAVQTDKTGDQLIATIIGNMKRAPAASTLDVGKDTFPYAGDTWRDERTMALAAFQNIAMSEMGYIYVKGDSNTGGLLRFENRHTRITTTTPASTLNNTMVNLTARRMRSNVYNRFKVTAHPRTVDSGA